MAVKKIQQSLAQKRREAAKQDLRKGILAASREIIASEGFAALTMRRLAERVGYSAASLYLHFRNRDEIACEVSRSGYADLLAALRLATKAYRGDAAARLRALAKAYVEFGLGNPQTYKLIFLEEQAYLKAIAANSNGDDPATQSYELLVGVAAELIGAGLTPAKVQGKRLRAVTAMELAETLWAGLHGIVSLKLTCPAFPTAPAEVMTQVMIETMLSGLKPA